MSLEEKLREIRDHADDLAAKVETKGDHGDHVEEGLDAIQRLLDDAYWAGAKAIDRETDRLEREWLASKET